MRTDREAGSLTGRFLMGTDQQGDHLNTSYFAGDLSV